MAHLITLDKKLFTVEHKINPTVIKEMEENHNVSKDEIQKQIQRELYQKFMSAVHKNIQTQVTKLPDGEDVYRIAGYVLSELSMMELIQECLEMDEMGKQQMLEGITKAITYRSKNVK